MPNWGDDEGRYWWNPTPYRGYQDCVEIPHPPVFVQKGCRCAFCRHTRDEAKDA